MSGIERNGSITSNIIDFMLSASYWWTASLYKTHICRASAYSDFHGFRWCQRVHELVDVVRVDIVYWHNLGISLLYNVSQHSAAHEPDTLEWKVQWNVMKDWSLFWKFVQNAKSAHRWNQRGTFYCQVFAKGATKETFLTWSLRRVCYLGLIELADRWWNIEYNCSGEL